MAEQLTPRTPGRLSCCIIRQGTLHHFVSLHPDVEMGVGDILLGRGGGGDPAIGLWLVYAFFT